MNVITLFQPFASVYLINKVYILNDGSDCGDDQLFKDARIYSGFIE